jgi:uncharacterized protein YbjT (DUF2867 family)
MTTTAESPILVLGATGGQGGAVTAALLARQARVRAMVRRPGEPSVQRLTERGVEVMVGSLDDRAALGAAMEGAAAVFALTTPFEAGVDAEVAQGRAIVAAADDARVPHLVFSSVAGADQHTGVPHFDSKAIIEKGLAASGLRYTITARRTSSTTRWAGRGPTASRPGYSICRCRLTGLCSSWPARI